MSLTILDVAVVLILLLSAILAFVRGFVRELFSVVGWAGAALAVYFGLPLARPFARDYISDPRIADIAAGAVIFLVVLVIVMIISAIVSPKVRESRVRTLDGTLGLMFGLVRGAVLVLLAYILLTTVYPEKTAPSWIKNALTKPYLESGADYVKALAPEDMFNRSKKAVKEAGDKAKELKKNADTIRKATNPDDK